MNTKLIASSFSVLMLLGSCAPKANVNDKGITVSISQSSENAPKLVRLDVLGENIIHVSATPEDSFKDPESLVVVPQEVDVEYTVTESGDTTIVETSALKAYVLSTTGEVWFTDSDGKLLLREQVGGGKTFEPIEVDGTHGYSFRQIFESPEDEALYGLGQHQADEFNYKGKNEQLFQYNTKVSVPFIVSNKGYGVLMDSYSMMRFGNPEDFKLLGEVFTLYDAEGNEGALTGTYVPAAGETLVRREPQIYFEHLVEPEMARVINLPEGFRFYGSEVTYEGFIQAPESGEYQFSI